MYTSERPHKRLDAWKRAIDFVVRIYAETSTYPQSELYGLVSQQRRAAVSVASNIAEGLARRTKKEKIQFLSISKGSLSELDTQLEISTRLGYINAQSASILMEEASRIQMLINGLVRSIDSPS